MRWGFVVVCLLGACDYVFEIKVQPDGETRGSDDAPGGTVACPAIGTAPTFVANPTQIVAARCKYSESATAGLAIADCVSGTGILEGPPGGPFSTPTQLDLPAGMSATDVRISPEGDQLIALISASTGNSSGALDVYTRAGDAWQSPATLPIASLVNSDTIGAASVKSGRHVMIGHQDLNIGSNFSEWRDLGNGSWDTPHAYTADSFGLATIGHPSLTPDGKRLVFVGEIAAGSGLSIYYSDRASIDDAFAGSTNIPVVEQFPFFPFLAADCSRLYFAGVASVSFIAP